MNVNDIPTNANPLDLDYSQVNIQRAVLPGNKPYELTVRKAEIQKYGPQSSHPNDEFIYIELVNARPETGPTGDPINPGQVVIFDRINLKAYGKATLAMVGEQIARFQQALGLTGPLRQVIPSATGRIVKASLKLDPAGTNPKTGKTFPEKNSVSYYLKANQ